MLRIVITISEEVDTPPARVIDFATQKRILAMKEELAEWERQHRWSVAPVENCRLCQQRRAAIAALETA